jgi:tetratricopeptide (TPR) repeat protein
VLSIALGGALLWRAHPTDGDAAKVAEADSPEEAARLAEEALRWHPADFLPAAIAGARLVQADRCAAAMPWLLRAMTMNPTAPEPHQLAGRCLAASGQGPAARREYRLALLFGSPTALEEASRSFRSARELMDVAPETGDGLLRLGAMLMTQDRPEDASIVLRRALDELQDARATMPLARALMTAGETEEALALAQRRTVDTPTDPDGWRVAAQLLAAQERHPEAKATLEEGLSRIPGSPALVEAIVYRALSENHPAEARRHAESMAARTPFELALREILIAATLSAQGRRGEAFERARQAVGAYPDSPWPLMSLAGHAKAAGRIDDAIQAVERASNLPEQSPEAMEQYQQRLAELKKLQAQQHEERLRNELLKR